MATGPKNGWGGSRVRAGRPRTVDLSRQERGKFVKAARAAAKKYGRAIHDELARLCYEATDERTQLMAIKIYIEATKVNESRSEVTTTTRVEAPIILPEARPDPATEVVELPEQKRA